MGDGDGDGRQMVHLCMADGSFHARVLVARLGAEGILAQTRGDSAGPYPLATEVEVLVPAEELAVAREVLLFDDLEAPVSARRSRSGRSARVVGMLALLVLLSMCAAAVAQLAQLTR